MDHNLLLKNLQASILPHLPDEAAKAMFAEQVKLIKKALIGAEFKLKRTIRDKQITTNVLESTISELKLQGKNLKHQKALTEEQAKFKEQLFTNVSHELRTPLHGILGMSHLLINTPLDQEQKGYVDIVKSSADNLLVIINDLLNLSKINAGKTLLHKEAFSIEKFFHDLEGVLAFKAKNKGLNLIFFKAPNLPETIIGDRTRLYQILLNLLNNAIKFTNDGYVALNVYVLQREAEKIDLRFEVKDTGIGIPKNKLEAIFENFTQLHSDNSDVQEGFGLGLNIVKKLIALLDGKIEVASIPQEGTTFSVNIGFEIPSNEEIIKHKNTVANLKIPAHWQSKKILLLEDNKANLVYAKNMFAQWDITLSIAETIGEANKKIITQKYDCILSDVKLPDGNGMDFIAQLRADNSAINQQTPIMVLTASANEKEETYAKKLNVQAYLGKPFPPEILIQEMKKILGNFKNGKVNAAQTAIKIDSNNTTNYFEHLEKNFKGKAKLQIEMFDIFLEQLPLAITQMGKGLEENDIAIFHYDAHRIKSTINIIGLPKLKPIITKMDEFCYKKINLDQLPLLYEQFKVQAAEDVELILAKKDSLALQLNPILHN